MIKEINKKLFENQLGDIPLLIIDEEGKIIAANKISRRMFPIISNDISFYDMFGNLISQNIRKSIFESGIQNRIFKASYKIEKAVDEDIEYQITVSPFNSHDEIQYFVTLIPLKDKYHQQNVYIYKSDLDDIIQDVDLRNIIGKIKSSFPFTFIGKVKVSNEVDTIGFPIWVKDANRKFVLSNNKFASTQELNNNEIEGRIGEDFQTEISKQLYDDVDAFIKDTANSVVIEKYYAQQTQGKYGIKISAESPIYDLDQNVIGYIGFTKYMDEKDLESDNPVAIKYINSTKKEAQVEMDDILLQTSPEPIFIYETDNLKFVEVNDVALKLYGYKREEFLQMDLTDLYAPEDIQTLIESSTDKSTTGSFSGPWRHKTKPGKSILVEISKSSVTFRGKEVNINVVRDVTEKLEMEKKLKSYKATFDNSNDLIFLVDKSGFITHSNDRVKVELGYSKSDLEQKQFLSIVSDEDRANLNSMILQSSKKEATTLDVGIKKSSSGIIQAHLNAIPILDYKDQIDSYNFTLTTLNSDANRSSSSGQTVVAASSKEGLDTSFLSNLFHELLTPVNVIIGFAHEIYDNIENPNAEQREAAEIIQENQKILIHTMDTAAEYASLHANKISVSPTNIKFIEILDDIQSNTKKSCAIERHRVFLW